MIASVLTIITSCAKFDSTYRGNPINNKGEYAIVFSNGNRAITKSIADPSTTHDYTSFEVYAWQDGTATSWSPYTVSKSGNEWKYDETTGQELQYFDRNSEKYDFLGVITSGTVHPANGSVALNVTGVKAFENNDDEITTPDELLWAQASVVKAAYDSEVALTFNHANAKMYIGFVSDRNDTQILDYTPYTPATPGQAAWDEDVVTTTYSVTGKPFPAQGPVFATSVITQEDINYVNSKYSTTGTWVTYYSSSVAINGPLNEDMWSYLTSKYPTLASEDLKQWSKETTHPTTGVVTPGPVNNPNMKLVHMEVISGSGDSTLDGCIRGWFVNVANMSNTPTEVHTTVHHDAVPATPATGCEGIRVFSVSKNSQDKNIRTAHTTEASAVLTSTCVLTQTANSGDGVDSNITFVKPATAVSQVADFDAVTESTTITWSPTVWYALPVANPDNGYVVKFSYTYNGVNYYDARVHISATDSAFEQGKYYRYVICIGNKTNGSTDPSEATTDKDEVDTDSLPIKFTVYAQSYSNGVFKSYKLAE